MFPVEKEGGGEKKEGNTQWNYSKLVISQFFYLKKYFNLNLFTVRDLFNFPLDWQKQKSKVGSMCYCVGG